MAPPKPLMRPPRRPRRKAPAHKIRLDTEQPEVLSREALALKTPPMLVDDLSQRLTAILVNLDALLLTFRKTPPTDPEIHLTIADVSRDASCAAQIVRQMRAIAARRDERGSADED